MHCYIIQQKVGNQLLLINKSRSRLGYRPTSFHAAASCALIAVSIVKIIQIGKHVRPIEVLIALLSAITHDIDHPGVNQSFLVATNDKLANLYKVSSCQTCAYYITTITVWCEPISKKDINLTRFKDFDQSYHIQ